MKVALLQFAPELGQVEANIQRADALLNQTSLGNIDWLILPEMAFSGYNFESLDAIRPHLEPTGSGVSTKWAQSTAMRLNCHVTVGYPEVDLINPLKRYNSTITVSPTGQILQHYRKHFLYYTDETWADEGEAFFSGELGALGPVVLGICMDINPYKFLAEWSAYEFAQHALTAKAPVIALSMAWLTRMTPQELNELPFQPDQETLAYWVERFYPLLEKQSSDPVVIILANRCGMENEACYAGTSTVLRIENGLVNIYDILGKCEEKCLVVDLSKPPKFALQSKAAGTGGETPA